MGPEPEEELARAIVEVSDPGRGLASAMEMEVDSEEVRTWSDSESARRI